MKAKKFLAIISAVIILAVAIPVSGLTAFAATSGTTGDCTWVLNGTVLTIRGIGKTNDYPNSADLPWGTAITEVIVEDDVTEIGEGAFADCINLTRATIGNGVISVGPYTFYNCPSLENVVLGNNITLIDQGAFYDCTSLTSINIPDSVVSIAGYAFKNCKKLTNINMHNSVTSIGSHVFEDCTSLENITLPESITEISSYAFKGCSSLKSIIIPNGVTSLALRTFENCSSLESVTIPKSVTEIKNYVFYNCNSLKDVYYNGTAEEKNSISIGSNNTSLTQALWHCKTNCGDANEDGEINSLDLSDLRAKLLNSTDYIQNASCDTNGNGIIDACDLVRLKKYLAGVDVVLGK